MSGIELPTMTKQIRIGSMLFLLAVWAVAPASGGVITYQTSSAFTTAIGTPTGTIDFTGLSSSPTSPLTVSGTPLQFGNPDPGTGNHPVNIKNDGFGPGGSTAGNYLEVTYSGVNIISTALSTTPLTALGFNLGCWGCAGTAPTSITVDFIDSTNTVLTGSSIPSTTSAFWGLTSTVGISDVKIVFSAACNCNYSSLDNVQYVTGSTGGDGGATPEAATFLMIGSGLAVVARYRRAIVRPTAV
jgi:hypothetical protein